MTSLRLWGDCGLKAALDGGGRERGAATRPRRCAQRGRLAHPATTGMRGSVDSDAWAPPKTKPRGDQSYFRQKSPQTEPSGSARGGESPASSDHRDDDDEARTRDEGVAGIARSRTGRGSRGEGRNPAPGRGPRAGEGVAPPPHPSPRTRRSGRAPTARRQRPSRVPREPRRLDVDEDRGRGRGARAAVARGGQRREPRRRRVVRPPRLDA